MIDEVKEFIGDTSAAAEANAMAFFGVPREGLEMYVIPPSMRVSGLGSRVLVLAARKQPSSQLGDVGEFVRRMLEQLGLDRGVRIDESEEEGRVVVRVQSAQLDEAERRIGGVEASLAHLADRAAQRLIDEEASAAVVVVREARSRDGGRRRPAGDRERDRDRGERDRGDRKRGERGGRDREPRTRERQPSRDEAELEAVARRAAEEVRRTGEAKLLAPMTARERWVVHNAIKDFDGVTSQSVGEGDQKRVKIFPD
jgi:predicted RNA-binding protein Jag